MPAHSGPPIIQSKEPAELTEGFRAQLLHEIRHPRERSSSGAVRAASNPKVGTDPRFITDLLHQPL